MLCFFTQTMAKDKAGAWRFLFLNGNINNVHRIRKRKKQQKLYDDVNDDDNQVNIQLTIYHIPLARQPHDEKKTPDWWVGSCI